MRSVATGGSLVRMREVSASRWRSTSSPPPTSRGTPPAARHARGASDGRSPPQTTRRGSAIPPPPDGQFRSELPPEGVGREVAGLLLGDPPLEPGLVVPVPGVLPHDHRGLPAVCLEVG